MAARDPTRCSGKKCGAQIPAHARSCVVCGRDAGFPNVRASETQEEREALEIRFSSALLDADARGCREIAEEFASAIRKSARAVVCRNVHEVNALVSSDDALYPSYHKRVRAEIVLPARNDFDPKRPGVDGTFFPGYQEEIRFAALSLARRGSGSYGAYAIVMNDAAISRRASVFEENTLVFTKRFGVLAGGPVPHGYRATWAERHKLAVAKLHPKLSSTTDRASFPGILLQSKGRTDQDDFIEVHIYGPLHRRGIKVVVGPKHVDDGERALQLSIDRKLREVGSHLEIVG